MAEIARDSDKIELDQQRLSGDMQLKALQVGSQIKNNELQRASQDQQAGVRMGSEIAKNKAQIALQEKQALLQQLQNSNQGTPKK